MDVNNDGQILNSSVIVGRDDGYHRLIRIDGIDILSPAASEETRLIPPVAWCEYVRNEHRKVLPSSKITVGPLVSGDLVDIIHTPVLAAQDPEEYISEQLNIADDAYLDAVRAFESAKAAVQTARERKEKWDRLWNALKEGDKHDE